MARWLVKSEPEDYAIDDLERDRKTLWTGVRNYQARNFLQSMKPGDELFFYHSNGEPPGIAGLARVSKPAVPDPTQFDSKSDYFDPKATREAPRWFCPEVEFVRRFDRLLPLDELRRLPGLEAMELLRRGSRLSVQPVTDSEFMNIAKTADLSAKRKKTSNG